MTAPQSFAGSESDAAGAAAVQKFFDSRAVRVIAAAKLRVESKRIWERLWAAAGCRENEVTIYARELGWSVGASARAGTRGLETLASRKLIAILSRDDRTGETRIAVYDPTRDDVRRALRAVSPDPQGELELLVETDGESRVDDYGAAVIRVGEASASDSSRNDEAAALDALVRSRRREAGLLEPPTPPRAGSAVCTTEPPTPRPIDLLRDLSLRPTRPTDFQTYRSESQKDHSLGGSVVQTAEANRRLDFDAAGQQQAARERYESEVARLCRKIEAGVRTHKKYRGVRLKWAQAIAGGRMRESDLNSVLASLHEKRRAGTLGDAFAFFIGATRRKFADRKVPWEYLDLKED